MKDKKQSQLNRMMEYGESCGEYGFTCDELEAHLGLYRLSPRMTDLKNLGAIGPIGRRKTSSGRWAVVYATINVIRRMEAKTNG